jgi:hypothetical protein
VDPCSAIKCAYFCRDECGWDSILTNGCATGSKTSTVEQFEGECPPDIAALAPNDDEFAVVGSKDSTSAVGGIEELYWYVIAGAVVFMAIVSAVLWTCKDQKQAPVNMSSVTDTSLNIGRASQYIEPSSPMRIPEEMMGARSPSAMSVHTDYGEQPPMNSFFPPEMHQLPPRMLSNESLLSAASASKGVSLWTYLGDKEMNMSTLQIAQPTCRRDMMAQHLLLQCATPGAQVYYTVDKTDPVVPPTKSDDHSSVYVGTAAGAQQGALDAVRAVIRNSAASTGMQQGAGTHLYDFTAPNNLLRITPDATLGQPLEVRCIAVKEGMLMSKINRHVDHPSLSAAALLATATGRRPAAATSPSSPNASTVFPSVLTSDL